MDRAASVSNCHCNGCLCHSCLVKEVALTYNRGTNVTACTVCQKEYTLTTHHHWNWKRDCPRFCRQLKCCGLRQDEFIMDTTTGILGYGFVLIGISLWIICSGIIFTLPPHRLPLFVYYLLGSFDFAVMISSFWFLDKCRYLTTFGLSILYLLRCGYLALGYMPGIHFLSIGLNGLQYINVVAYFVLFSFVAFLCLTIVWVKELSEQITEYKRRHQTLFLNGRRLEMARNELSIDVLDDSVAPDVIR